MANPNIYRLSTPVDTAPIVRVDYSTGAGGAIPGLRYEEAGQTQVFGEKQLRIVQSDLGNVVSVTLQMTVDAGSTTFSLVVPAVNLGPTNQAAVQTLGIKTVHRLSVNPAFNEGQVSSYSVIALEGSAVFRAF